MLKRYPARLGGYGAALALAVVTAPGPSVSQDGDNDDGPTITDCGIAWNRSSAADSCFRPDDSISVSGGACVLSNMVYRTNLVGHTSLASFTGAVEEVGNLNNRNGTLIVNSC